MEATFVRSLYGQQGLGHLGVHGNSVQIDDDCVESRPVDAYGCCTSHPTEVNNAPNLYRSLMTHA